MEFKTPTIEDKEEIDRCILADDTRSCVITGKKESIVYEYDSIGRPIWYEHNFVTGYTKSYPAFLKYFDARICDMPNKFNFDN